VLLGDEALADGLRASTAGADQAAAVEGPVTARMDLDAALAALPPDARLCVVLAYSEGMSHAEISESTAMALGTVKSHIARGAARLRELLQGYGDPHV
jgi:DNA-directed RNA polymerase specialized sigma24 family protein